MNRNAYYLLKERYCHKDEQPQDVYKRVAETLSLGDEKFKKTLLNTFNKGDFLVNSPALRNAGYSNFLHACFVLSVEDSIESLFGAFNHCGIIFKFGGGVGINYSNLRPKDSPLSSGGSSSGVISFMSIFNAIVNTIKQGGMRRGAMMGVLNCNHSEIIDFVKVKFDPYQLTNFNLSVLVNDEFINKVLNDEKVDLINPKSKEVTDTISAKDLFELIVVSAWTTGDPGLLFYDRINRDNKTGEKIITTNPCGEVPLTSYEACCLGSINLSNCVKRGQIDFKKLKKLLTIATRALLNMNAIAKFPLKEIYEKMKKYNRIGVGVMGFADMLIKLGVLYDSEDTLKIINEIGQVYVEITDKLAPKSTARRSIAPTGSLSILGNCSASIEPIFAEDFEKHLTIGIVRERRKLYESKCLRVAHEISPEWHLKIQTEWQKHVDNAVSKTINLPNNCSQGEIRKVYLDAYKMGCKGITVYRDKSREGVYRKTKCIEGVCNL